MNDKEKIEKVSKLFDELESMICIRNKEIRIKPTYDPTEEYSFRVYLTLIEEIKSILKK
jgi:CRISPR/Cas system-associated protein Csx1